MGILNFSLEYKKITEQINSDFVFLDELLEKTVLCCSHQENQIIPILNEFLSHQGKRIRSTLIFLLIKSMGKNPDELCYKLALANELIHNATLIHDDIIDCSLLRRGRNTLHFDYDSKLAVLAGDYLLAEVLKLLFDVENYEIRMLYSNTVSNLIRGELKQYFNRFKLLSIENYIEKSKNKTARLFEAGLVSAYLHNDEIASQKEAVREFALNFGIAFQIDNDLKNFENDEKLAEDFANGDYSAPLIYFANGKNLSEIKNVKKLLKQVKNSDAIDKTIELKKHYIDSAIENISFLEDNQYKQALINLCRLYSA